MDNKLNGLAYFFKNRKLLIFAAIFGGVLGMSITFFIPKEYRSSAIVYPYSSHTVRDIVSNPQFGFEVETEQLLQLLESKTMRDRTIEKFKLYDYYELDTTELGWRSELSLKYISNVEFYHSKYLSVVINVVTKSPELSADIANFQVSEVNNYREQIFKENRMNEVKKIEKEFLGLEIKVNTLRDSIYLIKGSQGDLLYNFVEQLDNENYNPKEFVDNPALEHLVQDYLFHLGKYKQQKVVYSAIKQTLSEPLPSVYIIDRAAPSYKKISPSFVMNGFLGAILFFGLTLTLRLFSDKWKELKAGQ